MNPLFLSWIAHLLGWHPKLQELDQTCLPLNCLDSSGMRMEGRVRMGSEPCHLRVAHLEHINGFAAGLTPIWEIHYFGLEFAWYFWWVSSYRNLKNSACFDHKVFDHVLYYCPFGNRSGTTQLGLNLPQKQCGHIQNGGNGSSIFNHPRITRAHDRTPPRAWLIWVLSWLVYFPWLPGIPQRLQVPIDDAIPGAGRQPLPSGGS